jgi:hypothetical protein
MKIKIVLKSTESEYYQVGQVWWLDRKWYTVTYQFTFLWFRYVVLRCDNISELHDFIDKASTPIKTKYSSDSD